MSHSIPRRFSVATALALSWSFATALAIAQGSARVALPVTVVVHTDSMSLADLLPGETSSSLRMRARDILMGAAPRAGSQRMISRFDLVRALNSSPDLLASLEIPQTIDVKRWSRPLTREEIAAAIDKSLAKTIDRPPTETIGRSPAETIGRSPAETIDRSLTENDASQSVRLSADDVTLDSIVVVTEQAPALDVMRIEPQSGAAISHVALWIPSEPRTPPFWVTVDRKLGSASGSGQRSKSGAQKYPQLAQAAKTGSQSPSGSVPANVSLVHAGKPVQLIVQGAGMRITAKATALETGRQGQQIRVQCEPAGKIVLAKVVSAAAAEIDF
jgi:hypothetical protein